MFVSEATKQLNTFQTLGSTRPFDIGRKLDTKVVFGANKSDTKPLCAGIQGAARLTLQKDTSSVVSTVFAGHAIPKDRLSSDISS